MLLFILNHSVRNALDAHRVGAKAMSNCDAMKHNIVHARVMASLYLNANQYSIRHVLVSTLHFEPPNSHSEKARLFLESQCQCVFATQTDTVVV